MNNRSLVIASLIGGLIALAATLAVVAFGPAAQRFASSQGTLQFAGGRGVSQARIEIYRAGELIDVLNFPAARQINLKSGVYELDVARVPPPNDVVAATLWYPKTVRIVRGETQKVEISWLGTAKPPLRAPLETPTNDPGWTALFNGRDLTGWETHPEELGHWSVENGEIVGTGAPGYLFSKRNDFTNFHLRFETRINAGGDGGVLVRSPFERVQKEGLPGYETQIQAGQTLAPGWKTGAIGRSDPKKGWRLLQAAETVSISEEWLPMEIVVRENHIQTKISGQKVAEYTDLDRLFSSGRIVLQQSGANTRISFRKIEIKEQ